MSAKAQGCSHAREYAEGRGHPFNPLIIADLDLLKAFQHLFHSGPMTSLAVDSSAWPLIPQKLTQDTRKKTHTSWKVGDMT